MYSFDVFDTLITRKVTEPKEIFGLVYDAVKKNEKNTQIENLAACDFIAIRVEAEKKARVLKGTEVTLDDIYDQFQLFLCLSDETRKIIQEKEIELEIENAVGVTENLEKVNELCKKGERVILISDMYLSRDVYVQIFKNNAPFLNKIPLYISSEEGVTKSGGLLYKLVADKENISFFDWIHIGDNMVSDVTIPSIFGIQSEQYDINENKKYKDIQVAKGTNCCSKAQKDAENLASSMKEICADTKSNGFYLGYSYIGIIIYAFVSWIIYTAIQKGIRRIFFILRDGYVMKLVADEIITAMGYDIETHYLYGSRKAWNPDNEEKKDILCKYLKQEISNAEQMDFALVDAKGTGKSIDALAEIIGHPIQIFYYAILEPVGHKRIIPYVFSAEGGFIEHFCRAPYGPTEGYCQEDGIIVPIIDNNRSLTSNTIISEYLKGAERFAIDFCGRNNDIRSCFGLFCLAIGKMRECCTTSSIDLASIIGDIPQDDDNCDECYAPLVDHDSIYKIEYLRTVQALDEYYSGDNLQYSYKRLDKTEKEWLEKCREDYYADNSVVKKADALKVAIYAFGAYGQELYHRLFKSEKFDISVVVDINFQKNNSGLIEVDSPSALMESKYDLVVIALASDRQAEAVVAMLEAAGIDGGKIVKYKEFVEKYL